MEEQDSILLQKKMILFLSAVIITLLFAITFKTNFKMRQNVATIETYKQNVITVKKFNEYDYVVSEQVTFLASKEVLEKVNNEDNVVEILDESGENQETNEVQNEKEKIEEEKVVSYRELAENNPPTEYKAVIEATATAYCLCEKCCGKSPSSPGYGVTASGLKIVPGTGMKVIAVDPSIIPLGSKVYVEGLNGAWDYGNAIAADTGGAIKSMKIDLYMDSHQETLNWGRKKVNIYIVD